MRCAYCESEHAKASEVKACWQRSDAVVLAQIREHGLAAAGLGTAPADKEKRADELRGDQTPSEGVLGSALKKLRWEFLAQDPRFGYILDFYAPEVSLAVEVDGSSHRGRETADQLRDEALASHGIRVLRFTADEVRNDLDGVLRSIRKVGRSRRGKRDRHDFLDAAWELYRYGLPAPEPVPGPPLPLPTARVPKCKWKCLECDRDFIAERHPPPQCRNNPKHRVRAICKRCKKATAKRPPVCDTCRDAADVARESAGPGAHAPGDHLRQARKAKRWRG